MRKQDCCSGGLNREVDCHQASTRDLAGPSHAVPSEVGLRGHWMPIARIAARLVVLRPQMMGGSAAIVDLIDVLAKVELESLDACRWVYMDLACVGSAEDFETMGRETLVVLVTPVRCLASKR